MATRKKKPRRKKAETQSTMDKIMGRLEQFPELYEQYRAHLARSRGRIARMDRYLSGVIPGGRR
jgi:hypothetical protein